jgi:Ca2+-binding EF-hand superfamily protein
MSLKEILTDKKKLDWLCKAAFDVVDTDKSGFLDKIELEAVMSSVASELGMPKSSKEDVDGILKELDKNDLGKVGLGDFRVMVEQILTQIVEEEQMSSRERGAN